MSKKILFLNRSSPYGSSLAQDGLDTALAAALFDQEVSIVFMDDGVYQCLPDQDASLIQKKSISKQLSALSLYDISSVYIHQESMKAYLTTEAIASIDTTIFAPIDSHGLQNLIHQHDHILSF